MKSMTVLIAATLFVFGVSAANARSGGGKGGERTLSADLESEQGGGRRGIRPSGLVPVFPADAKCVQIASPYASPTRYDGSSRPRTRFGGLHGGMDLTLDEKTPLLAMASGKVIASGVGGQAEGIYIWLQHAPTDTGLPFWAYSKYQHLSELPGHAIGDVIKAGDSVGLSGKTGTAGGHYGVSGYAHLHLTTFAGASERYQRDGSRIVAEGVRIIDPLSFFVQDLASLDELDQLSGSRKSVRISYVATDGAIRPADSRVVWPVACRQQ